MSRTQAVLIIGGSGYIGTHLALRLREKYKVFATYHAHPFAIPGVTMLPLNVANRTWIKRVVYTAKPDVILYAAGSNSLPWAESNVREAENVHTGGPATVSNIAEILQPKFIYLSNCYPFDGTKGNYRENDTVLPGTALGKAKVGAENFIRGKSLNYLILRSSPVFGRGNGINLSFLDRLRMNLDRGIKVEFSNEELHSFAPISGLINLVERLVGSGIRNRTYHHGGLTKVTYYEFAQAFAARFGYDSRLVSVRKVAAPRHGQATDGNPGHDYSLNSTLAVQDLKLKPLLLEEGLDLINQHLVARP